MRVARASGNTKGVQVTALLMLLVAGLRSEEVEFNMKVKKLFSRSGMKRITRKEYVQ